MCWKREDLFGEVWEDEKILIPSWMARSTCLTVNRNNSRVKTVLRYCRLQLLWTWSCVVQDARMKHGADLAVRELGNCQVKCARLLWSTGIVHFAMVL